MKYPEVTPTMNDEQKKDFLSLLIRYLCLANNYQRTKLNHYIPNKHHYIFKLRLSLDEQREFQDALSQPTPAFEPMEKETK